MINSFKRNVDFLKSILQEKNRKRRMEKLLHASKDQINAVSEFTLNMLKKKIPLSPPTVAKLKKYRVMLRELGKRRNSLRPASYVAFLPCRIQFHELNLAEIRRLNRLPHFCRTFD